LEKKRVCWWTGIALAIIILGVAGFYYYRTCLRVEALPLIQETSARARQAHSYRYRVQANFNIGGRKQTWIQVQGEKASATQYHFRGNVLGTPVEVYQTGTRSYTLDPASKHWLILEGTDLAQQQIFMAELNPLSNFQYQAIDRPKLLEPETVDGRNCWVVEFRPRIENKFLEMWWDNFIYRFWVDRQSRQLTRAMATAENKNSPGTFLTMVVDFQDYNQNIDFHPPEQ
jgi:hypothetical protein